ncbi:ribonuclease H [Trifolium pratense]|uniref:Ribonuclease H n=1 Tax=Trifolium pratense TaxID=57577 RepID=A0A2K3PA99_TRIPR|nr:ribonuclease H [Trifolium pratense]
MFTRVWRRFNLLLFRALPCLVPHRRSLISMLILFVCHGTDYRPAEGTVFLNVDGSLLGSSNTAELMAVLHGLNLCWDSGYRKIVRCSDSLLSVNLIKEGVTIHHRFANEGNACADVLAKLGATSNTKLVKITTPTSELLRPLLDHAWGVEFTRE